MEEKDDEISIDFGKIKNFFKRKKEEKEVDRKLHPEGKNPEVYTEIENKDTETKHEQTQSIETKQEEKEDDEISIDAQKSKISGIPENSDEEFSLDFGKIKNIFKKKEEEPIKVGTKETGEDAKTKEDKEDDEISIDFSKIKNIFKKKDSKSEEVKAKEDREDDEIAIDFSKIKNIKNIFKKSDKTGAKESDEDISIDFKKIKDFFSRHGVLLLLIIPIFLSISLRVQPAYLPITDTWATDSVINNLRSQVSGQIYQQILQLFLLKRRGVLLQ